MFQMTIQPPAGQAFAYLLNRRQITLGSADDCDIVISHPSVRACHARLNWVEQKGFQLTTGDPDTPLPVNGIPVTSAILEDGDRIEFGEVRGTMSAVADVSVDEWEDHVAETVTQQAARVEELEDTVMKQLAELSDLRPLRNQLAETRDELDQTREALTAARAEAQEDRNRLSSELENLRSQAEQAFAEQEAARQHADALQQQLADTERRLREGEADARKRIERAHENIANLRRTSAQQDAEIRDQRQTILKLQQAKNAAETQLDSIKKSYSRDRKQHGRLVSQYQERTRQEMARADMARDELARVARHGEADGE